MPTHHDRICGAVLASALGDAFGAPYEGGVLEQLLWRILGRQQGKRRWTDDTQMSVDVIESLLACKRVNQDDLAQRFAHSYRWSGYIPSSRSALSPVPSPSVSAFSSGSRGKASSVSWKPSLSSSGSALLPMPSSSVSSHSAGSSGKTSSSSPYPSLSVSATVVNLKFSILNSAFFSPTPYRATISLFAPAVMRNGI
ncbi:MAG: ADP-ribosylglycohydrolase family protein [Candidatus Electrothrix sp. AUS3]|nr:ADP-ribosylglycohydrolase family protein [Candidatus Electrothrix gigas]